MNCEGYGPTTSPGVNPRKRFCGVTGLGPAKAGSEFNSLMAAWEMGSLPYWVKLTSGQKDIQARRGTDQERGSAQFNLVELLRLAAVNGVEKTAVGSGRDFANVVVCEAFRIISDAIGIALLVAVGDFGRGGDGEFAASGSDANHIAFLCALISETIRACTGGLGFGGLGQGAEAGGADRERCGGGAAYAADEFAAAGGFGFGFEGNFVRARSGIALLHDASPLSNQNWVGRIWAGVGGGTLCRSAKVNKAKVGQFWYRQVWA